MLLAAYMKFTLQAPGCILQSLRCIATLLHVIRHISSQELIGHPCVLIRGLRPEILPVLLVVLVQLPGTDKTMRPHLGQRCGRIPHHPSRANQYSSNSI